MAPNSDGFSDPSGGGGGGGGAKESENEKDEKDKQADAEGKARVPKFRYLSELKRNFSEISVKFQRNFGKI